MLDLKGFSKLNRKERFKKLIEIGALTLEDVKYLQTSSGLDLNLAEHFIENVIGYFHLPLGVATHLVIDKKKYTVPMAVEETSIIAALSKTAKWLVKQKAEITTEVIGHNHIGQVQISEVKNFKKLSNFLKQQGTNLIEDVNKKIAYGLVRRGGGVKQLSLRKIQRSDKKTMAVVHVEVNTCDAMGANIINQIVEYLKRPLEDATGETVSMCILSNLVDTKVTKAYVKIDHLPGAFCKKIEEASLFAEHDPYRATTHNKGVLNGIDPLLIATGNDWRAVEAGIHAYATRKGGYQPITIWRKKSTSLLGTFQAPVIVATVGGVTHLHPTAQISLKMLGVKTSCELSRVCAAVGLVQNLGALHALVTKGIIEGHMKLHIKNLILGAGAKNEEIHDLENKLEKILMFHKKVSLKDAVEALKDMRREQDCLN